MKMKEPTFLLLLLIALAIVFIVLFSYSRIEAMSVCGTDATTVLQYISQPHAFW